jgi:hypothetical protein
MGPYTGNIAAMGEAEAIRFINDCDSQEEIEALFRIEVLGADRESVLLAGVSRYWQLNDYPPVRPPYPLQMLRKLWREELEQPEVRRMYETLMSVPDGEAVGAH